MVLAKRRFLSVRCESKAHSAGFELKEDTDWRLTDINMNAWWHSKGVMSIPDVNMKQVYRIEMRKEHNFCSCFSNCLALRWCYLEGIRIFLNIVQNRIEAISNQIHTSLFFVYLNPLRHHQFLRLPGHANELQRLLLFGKNFITLKYNNMGAYELSNECFLATSDQLFYLYLCRSWLFS